jgi:hypothetical protein
MFLINIPTEYPKLLKAAFRNTIIGTNAIEIKRIRYSDQDLGGAFVWKDSPEEHNFWVEIADENYDTAKRINKDLFTSGRLHSKDITYKKAVKAILDIYPPLSDRKAHSALWVSVSDEEWLKVYKYIHAKLNEDENAELVINSGSSQPTVAYYTTDAMTILSLTK